MEITVHMMSPQVPTASAAHPSINEVIVTAQTSTQPVVASTQWNGRRMQSKSGSSFEEAFHQTLEKDTLIHLAGVCRHPSSTALAAILMTALQITELCSTPHSVVTLVMLHGAAVDVLRSRIPTSARSLLAATQANFQRLTGTLSM